MNNNFSFISEEFQLKLQNVNTKVKEYLEKYNYTLPENLELKSLVEWNNFDGMIKIYPSSKCPAEIKGIITEFIKNEFPI